MAPQVVSVGSAAYLQYQYHRLSMIAHTAQGRATRIRWGRVYLLKSLEKQSLLKSGSTTERTQKAESARGVLQEIKSFNGVANAGNRKAIPIEKPRRHHSHAPLQTPDKQMTINLSPSALPPKGGVPRNPSPWPSPWRPDCIFEDREILKTPVTKSSTPIKRPTKKNVDQENVPPMGSLSATKDKMLYTPGVVTPLPNASPGIYLAHTPSCYTPLITPLGAVPSAGRSVASPQVADDPHEVCPVPSLTDPTFMTSRAWPLEVSPPKSNSIETITIYDAERCHSRQRRHTIALGSPETKVSDQMRNNCKSMMPYPWMCCSVNTVHDSCAYV